MQELGMIIDTEGKITFFGQWVKHPNENNPHEWHTKSFELEVASTDYFKSLGIELNSNINMLGNGVKFSEKEIITILNVSMEPNSDVCIVAPENINDIQKNKLKELTSILNSFESQKIVIPKNGFIINTFNSLDEFFNKSEIQFDDNIKR